MDTRDIWVDFNEVAPDFKVYSRTEYLTEGHYANVGNLVVAGDYEGNRCQARVLSVQGDVVELQLDRDTFHPAPYDDEALQSA